MRNKKCDLVFEGIFWGESEQLRDSLREWIEIGVLCQFSSHGERGLPKRRQPSVARRGSGPSGAASR